MGMGMKYIYVSSYMSLHITDNDNDNEKTFIAKVVQRKSANHTSTQFNLKDSSCQ